MLACVTPNCFTGLLGKLARGSQEAEGSNLPWCRSRSSEYKYLWKLTHKVCLRYQLLYQGQLKLSFSWKWKYCNQVVAEGRWRNVGLWTKYRVEAAAAGCTLGICTSALATKLDKLQFDNKQYNFGLKVSYKLFEALCYVINLNTYLNGWRAKRFSS